MHATHAARSGVSLRCLLPDEAAFIDAAFERILPEAKADGLKVSASRYVDAKLAHLAARTEEPASNPALTRYRSAIADVQAHCEGTLGQRFQGLPIGRQLAALALLERAADLARSPQGCLIDWLLNDAAEAYFDCAAKPSTTIAEGCQAVAA
jgi:hypothetical protein